ncbi:UvrD-helicase domain-containing protein [Desemzia sp. RIT804]|uniref:HelD family protein n=1 Tax=Desemzia sp. RIT 804 TaxID=2810209 RepID=UPI00194ECF49|nr:UvrD-helicase domain-containing protein [Desemzia sp. RIT 804]MBM6614898.1 UvrD-helicase domain-containing protein [Desemzia sp. RIT 804]
MVDTELRKEKEHLQFVYEQLLATEKVLKDSIERNRAEGISELKAMSSEGSLNFDSVLDNLDTFLGIEMKSREIDQMNIKLKTAEALLEKVERLLQSPYFGKVTVDFLDEEPDEPFYIGINGFSNEDRETLVYDWRSPIAELFYNNTLGKSSYLANQQPIDVDIKSRRQLIIEKDQLLNYFDTTVAIQDDVLLEALEQDTTKQMKDITATIQNEQNVIIRDMKHPILLVNGVAGSGKTSTVMQRIAYLLYSLRKEITSDNVLILSPNNQFINYISNVLPALGEKNPLNMTLLQFVGQQANWAMETETEYFSRISQPAINTQSVVLRSLGFVDFVKGADEVVASTDFLFKDLIYRGKIIISKEKMLEIYKTTPASSPVIDRIQATKQRLSSYWERRILTQSKSHGIQDQILEMSEKMQLKHFGELITEDNEEKVIEYGEQLLRKKYRSITKGIEQNKWVDLTHIFNALYFHYQKESYVHSREVLTVDEAVIYLLIVNTFVERISFPLMRFVLIDEVQDYTPAQMSLLSDLFMKSDFTMVGDENQAIFNSSITFQEITDIIENKRKSVQRYDLVNSYRSSGAITKVFSKLITANQKIEIIPVRPQGNDPEVYEVSDKDDFKGILEQILMELDGKTLTVITKSEQEAEELSIYLKENLPFVFSVKVLPISLSKGLEFDNVLVYDVSEENYQSERDQRILYTAVSRGMQNLFMTYKGNLSKFLQ